MVLQEKEKDEDDDAAAASANANMPTDPLTWSSHFVFSCQIFVFDVCCICVVFLSGDMPKPNFARTCHGLDSDVLLIFNHFAAFRTERTEAWHGCSWDASTLASGM